MPMAMSMLADRFITPLHDFDISEMYYLSDLAMRGKGITYVYILDAGGRVLVDASERAEAIGSIHQGLTKIKNNGFNDAITVRHISSDRSPVKYTSLFI